MTKKYMLLIGAVLICVMVASILLLPRNKSAPINGVSDDAQQKAIMEAQNYHPTGLCPETEVTAVHNATGAKYHFTTGCIPPGWEALPQTSQ